MGPLDNSATTVLGWDYPGRGTCVSKQRMVDTCFWDDGYVAALDPSEKLLFLYLLTNPVANICGIYEITKKRMALDTGFTNEVVDTILDRLERDGKAVYRDGWVAVKNWIKHQNTKSEDTRKGITRQLKEVPDSLAGWVKGGPLPAPYRPPTGPLLPNLTLPNLTRPNLTRPKKDAVALRAPARKSRDSYWRECGDLITERGGTWAAGSKEAVSLDRLFAWAKKREGENWQRFFHDFLDGAWALHGGKVMGLTPKDVEFWKMQPYTPSRLLSNAVGICAVLETIAERNREPTKAEFDRITVGIK